MSVEKIILEAIGSRSPEETRQWIQWNILSNVKFEKSLWVRKHR